ncbi:MAG: ABC transporter substrate-binding protein [Chloroflexota bacterium]
MTQNEKSRKLLSMNRRQFIQMALATGSVSALLAACAPAAAPSGSDAPADSGEAAESMASGGGELRLMGHQEVAGLSPENWGPSVQTTMIRAIHDSLMLLDENLDNALQLASNLDVSEDGLTYTFTLHEGVTFHDGVALTSADVKYTFDFFRNPDNASSIVNRFRNIDTIDTPDDLTVVINMSEVNAAFLTDGAQCPIVQSAYHAEVGDEAYAQAPVGSGPFKLVEFNPAEVVVVEAFDDYWQGRPQVDTIRQEVVPEPSVRTIALQTGDSDSALWPLLVEDSMMFDEDPGYNVIVTSSGGVKHFPLNNQLPQLSDKRVRQALMHALDRQRIIDDLWNGAAAVAHSNLSPKFAFYSRDGDESLKRYDYNPEGAMALLDEAGWAMGDDGVREKDGTKLSFTCTTITGDQARRPIAELAQQLFAEVGVDMQLAEAPISTILEGLRQGTVDAALFNWTYGSVDPDPSNILRSDGGQNWNSFRNDRVDELIDAGLAVADPEQRKPIYDEIQEIVTEEVPMLYLQWDEWMNVFTGRVSDLPETANDGFSIYYNGLRKFGIADG